jgi:hypothetical protein
MFSYSPFSDPLIVSIFFMRFFYSFPAFVSVFVTVFIILKAARFLASWSAIAIFFLRIERI